MADQINFTLSIIMPVYNEEECIELVINEINDSILKKLPNVELLVIDDGSIDRTPLILDYLAERYHQLKPFHKENGGHGDALLYGLNRANGKYIFLMDSDRQTDPNDFWFLWNLRHESDFICGVRTNRNDPTHRLVLTRLVRYGIWTLFGIWCRDANIPFKLFRKDLWLKISKSIPSDSLTPSLLLTLASNRFLGKIKEVNVNHLPRETGECSIRYFRLIKFCYMAFYQLLVFRYSSWKNIMTLKKDK